MFDDIRLHSPDFIIQCNLLDKSNEVYSVMRNMGITRSYVYAIAFNDKMSLFTYKFLKVGMSAPNPGEDREVQIGERIARQLHHMPGWKYLRNDPISSNGQDFMNAINNNIKNGFLPINLDKDDIVVGVWNISSRMIKSDVIETDESELHCSAWGEGELAYQHKKLYGQLPVCNKKDPSQTKFYSGYIPKNVGSLFGWA